MSMTQWRVYANPAGFRNCHAEYPPHVGMWIDERLETLGKIAMHVRVFGCGCDAEVVATLHGATLEVAQAMAAAAAEALAVEIGGIIK